MIDSREQQLVEQHVTKQGFFIVRETPDDALRMAHPNIVKMVWGPGYPAARTPMASAPSRNSDQDTERPSPRSGSKHEVRV